MDFILQSTEETENFGAALFKIIPKKTLVFLLGDLGAGKTTLVRGFMRKAGHKGIVKSPTYNIVEEYKINQRLFFHFDLYRLIAPEELEWIGIDDYLQEQSICFIEWPNNGDGYLAIPDLIISLEVIAEGRKVVIEKMDNAMKNKFLIEKQ
jgi:tRNA threonylcarbamoyladenosine biosynthesis protein TsaE